MFQEKGGLYVFESPKQFPGARSFTLTSEVQEEPVGLFSYPLPKGFTW